MPQMGELLRMRNSTSSQPFEPVDQDEPEHCRRLHSNFQAHWLAVEGYPGELETLRADNARLRRLLDLTEQHARAADPDQTAAGTPVDMRSSPEDKVRFYLDLFQCRQDVYAIRWEHRQDGRSGWMPAVRGGCAPIRGALPAADRRCRRRPFARETSHRAVPPGLNTSKHSPTASPPPAAATSRCCTVV